MKLLSYQPFPVYSTNGGSRILRRMYQGKEAQITSIVVSTEILPHESQLIIEKIIPASPVNQRWMRWHVRTFSNWLRENLLYNYTINRIRRATANLSFDVIHIVHHGPFSTALCDDSLLNDKTVWVSFHDHFSIANSSFHHTNKLWNLATRRLVISNELGREYQRLFGAENFELITDGVAEEELSVPQNTDNSLITIYFAGLLHIGYYKNFQTLADALDSLHGRGYRFKLIFRGTSKLAFLNERLFQVEYLPDSLDDIVLKKELDSAEILYLPIKFDSPDFYLYSLSTKMIGYLGASGTILYHGPKDSAACQVLHSSGAAACCSTLNSDDLSTMILSLLNNRRGIAINAKELARARFNLVTLQKRFWQEN